MIPSIPSTQLSVLHVVLSLDVGGLERVVLDLAREMAACGHTSSILCVDHPGLLAPTAIEVGAKLYCARKGAGLRLSAVSRVRSILREVRPDVVHTHQISALLYLTPITRELSRVLVHTEHSHQLRRYKGLRQKVRYLSMLAIAGGRADRVFGVSDDVTKSVRRSRLISPNKLFTVANGIDLTRFQGFTRGSALRRSLGIPDDSIVIGTVGRIDEVKRQDILLSAFSRISKEFPKTHLLVVGDGPLASELREQAENLKVSERVRFTGFQSDPEAYVSLLDVFVLTSRIEGMPLSVLEAQASGIPVIASKVGGLEEMSNNGESILLYGFGDMDALHERLRMVISDSNFRQRLGESGRQHVLAAYSSRRMALDYERHYAELLVTSGARRKSASRAAVDMPAQADFIE